MTQTPQTGTEAELDRLVARYRGADGPAIRLLNTIGNSAEDLLARLPPGVRPRLEEATLIALHRAIRAAHGSRRMVGEGPGWMTRALATAMGAAGGAGGLPTSLAELPVTTTVLLRAIQSEAMRLGFDPAAENVQFDCVQVFAASGPLKSDDGADLAFLGSRVALSAGGAQRLAAWVAPRLAVVLGQKLAAQAVPLVGAAAGAATNYAFIGYYQQMAHVHFGLRRLAIEADEPHDQLLQRFRTKIRPGLDVSD
ncbi:EcsC protein family protein [Salinihabitans flavidus]|uniref:EcsC protein family protein n=1 Tax=Salinihabitans flavidus TaxID=569882 RepID=A0A1H8NCD5_9RHOB|nr:EcsC family protein [Salinihabitans flavidus]SEO27109.1 EcsC protein family protein [Salinihabitans flavidus]